MSLVFCGLIGSSFNLSFHWSWQIIIIWSWCKNVLSNTYELGCWSWWPNHLPRTGMTQWIQYKLGKQYLWKKSYTTLGIEPKTYSYPGRISYHNCVSQFWQGCRAHPFHHPGKNVQDNFSHRRPLRFSCGALERRSYDTVAAVTPLLYWLLQFHWLLGVFLSSTSEPVLWDY